MTRSPDDRDGGTPGVAVAALVVAGYLLPRVVGLARAVVLEDHDSVRYLRDAAAWGSLDPSRIAALNPDSTPGFPLAIALVDALGPGPETAARLVSLLASIAVFLSMAALGRRLVGGAATWVGLALAAISPVLVGLSFAVLSEPLYVGLVHGGLALAICGAREAGPGRFALVGLLFGCAFLTRTEGVIFVVAIPALWLVLDLLERGRPRLAGAGRLAAFAVAFAAVALPQVISVSAKLGSPAINGRQVWMAVMNVDDDRSSDARVYGLDYAPDTINIFHLQRDPAAVAALGRSSDLGDVARIASRNLVELVRVRLPELVGWPALVCALAGAALLALRRRRDALAVLAVLAGAGLLGPLLYNVATRHVAIVAPGLCLLAGAGLVGLARRLGARRAVPVAAGLLLAVTLALEAGELERTVVDPPRSTREYAPRSLAEPAGIVRADSTGRPPRICARKDYLAWLTGGVDVPLPYTDLAGLERYLRLNDADYLFVDERLTRRFPFASQLPDAGTDVLEPLWTGRREDGRSLRLYRVRPRGAGG